ncbi:MAG: hypothetical protein A07HB70_01199 [uncultured archaeon A07HB70]|nr:MAG: hypothetical protein A07HB70_01199 [uncultured archaeon A07HB70]
MDRAAVDTDTLLRVALVLVVAWLALEVVDELLDVALGLLVPLAGLALVVLVVLSLLDRL